VKPTEIVGPLTQFQFTTIDKQEIFKLLTLINDKMAERKIDENLFLEIFEKWWPELSVRLSNIKTEKSVEMAGNTNSKRSQQELIEEILERVRELGKNPRKKKPSVEDYKSNLIVDGGTVYEPFLCPICNEYGTYQGPLAECMSCKKTFHPYCLEKKDQENYFCPYCNKKLNYEFIRKIGHLL